MMSLQPKSYRDVLDQRGIKPMVIHRTVKVPGDLVLTTWARPAVEYGK